MRTSLSILILSLSTLIQPALADKLPATPQNLNTQTPNITTGMNTDGNTGVELQAGKQYPGGSRIHLPYAGISITVPEQWIGIMPVGESEFIMRSTRIKGQLKVIALPSDIKAISDYMNRTINLENDIQLIPTGNSQLTHGIASNQYYVTNSYEPFKAHILGRPSTTAQVGSGFIGLGPIQDTPIYQKLIETLSSQATVQ